MKLEFTLYTKGQTRIQPGLYDIIFAPRRIGSVSISSPSNFIYSDARGMKLTTQAFYESGKEADIESETDISFKSSDTDIATVDEDGIVSPVSAGKVTITVSVKSKGSSDEPKTAEIALTVLPEKVHGSDTAEQFEINFLSVDYSKLFHTSGKIYYAGYRGDVAYPAIGDGWELVMDKEISTLLKNEEGVQFYEGARIYLKPTAEAIKNGDDAAVFKFTVPKTGIYDISADINKTTGGGYAEIYIDGSLTAELSLYNSETIRVITDCGTAYLEAGEHYLTVKSSLLQTKNVSNSILKLFFTPRGKISTVDIQSDMLWVKTGEMRELTVLANYANGTAVDVENGASVRFESSDEKIATVDANGVVTGKSEGRVTITAFVTIDGATVSGTFDIDVSDTAMTYDFEVDFSNGYKVEGETPYTATVEKNGWQVNLDETDAYLATSSSAKITQQSYGLLVSSDFAEDRNNVTFDFYVPSTGTYNISFRGTTFSNGAVGYIYIDNKFVGEYDFYSVSTLPNAYSVKLRPLMLEGGRNHTITFVPVKKGGDGVGKGALAISKFSFEGTTTLDGIRAIYADMQRSKIAVGETEPMRFRVAQNNGAEWYVNPMLGGSEDVTLTSNGDNDEIATVQDGIISAKAPGTVNFDISGTIDGLEISGLDILRSFTFTVNEETYDHAEIDVVFPVFYEGGKTEISATAVLTDGSTVAARDVNVSFATGGSEETGDKIATVEGNILSTNRQGKTTVTAYVTFNGITKDVTTEIEIVPVTLKAIEGKTEDTIVSSFDKDGSKLIITGRNNDGSEGSLEGATYTYEALTPNIDIRVDGNDGYVLALSRGSAKVKVSAHIFGLDFSTEVDVVSISQKMEPTFYTQKMRDAAQENIKKYSWAKSLQKSAVAAADVALEKVDALYYNAILYEGIPRAWGPFLEKDPEEFLCVYCKEDIREKFGNYAWGIDPINRPWKIQCPSCKRIFPSNDFGSFYKLGLDQKGQFNRLRALDAHRAMLLNQGEALPAEEITEERREAIATGDLLTDYELDYFGYGMGYLENTSYKEVNTTLGVPLDEVDRWCVDDGFGWDTRKKTTGEVAYPIKKMFMAAYHYLNYHSNGDGPSLIDAYLKNLTNAYLYTGDIKYARAGIILLDRIADVYPSLDCKLYPTAGVNGESRVNGKIVGSISDCAVADIFTKAYDAFYPAMDDPEVIRILSERAAAQGLENPKTTGDMIRENCETGILREIFKGAQSARLFGNFAMHQTSVTLAAIVLDNFSETKEMLDWVARHESLPRSQVTEFGLTFNPYSKNGGGGVLPKYVNDVDRDGFGWEIGVGYNQGWVSNSVYIADWVRRYGKYEGLDLFGNAKYTKMLESIIKMTMAGGYTLQVGDTSRTADPRQLTSALVTKYAFYHLRDPKYAQIIYYLAGGDVSETYLDIFQEDVEEFQQEIMDIIEKYGEYEFGSRNLTGFGLVVLSGGEKVDGANGADFRRDTWLWHGNSLKSHGHRDTLQMGIDAYGFNFTPDLGYPGATSNDPNRLQWVAEAISHNTVVVDGKGMNQRKSGDPLHYEGEGIVKLIDVEDPDVYDETDIYRRTLVSVDASPEVAYTVDFFRIRGGNEHTYSFHTQSADGVTTDDLELDPQDSTPGDFTLDDGGYLGSYAGSEVPCGADPNIDTTASDYDLMYPLGYTWLKHVRRATPESGEFTVNFKQTDFKKLVKDSRGLNLKFTALNDWTPSGVGIAVAEPPTRPENNVIPYLDYMLIHRTGKNLDTLFTSVIQPYKGEVYIDNMKSIPLTSSGGEGSDDTSKAVRVMLKSGRTDYIIYATNPNVTYTVNDEVNGNPVSFSFRGFVGVYSVDKNGNNIYSYVSDGDFIGNLSTTARLTGTVSSFTEELVTENFINVTMDEELTEEQITALAGKYVYIDNEGVNNGVYKIESASGSGKNVSLNIGDVSIINGYRAPRDITLGYTYDIAPKQSFAIPLSATYDASPIVEDVEEATTSAGSSITLNLKVESPLGEKITYIGTLLPRGASINSETGKVTWKPDSSQVGENGFFITVRDESGRESSTSFKVTVYGSTTGSSPSNKEETPSTEPSDTPAGGGGGGGGGGAAPTQKPNDDKTDAEEHSPSIPNNEITTQPNVGNEISVLPKFTDLGNHSWAADAIDTLAADGIIKGTSENSFSPASNITRADFAILLVRAFKLTSDNTENFADVSASDYFASELAIARNTGIVGGIGDNKFAPRNTITRQDMMVMVYRALTALNVDDTTISVGEGIGTLPQMEEMS
ncbi:MAG: S-layer homology domain-containing protein [Oscillospiraceae bacterium]|nr:S-layer homology domain-containing protein [Oscillospiraceae bacterium]